MPRQRSTQSSSITSHQCQSSDCHAGNRLGTAGILAGQHSPQPAICQPSTDRAAIGHVIDGLLIEVNVTCPGGMAKTDALLGTDLSGDIVRRLTTRHPHPQGALA